MTSRSHPSLDDPLVGVLSEGVGGPLGSRAGRHPWWTPVRVLLALTAVCFAVGMVQKSSCAESTWSDGQERYHDMCYSDLPYLYTGRGMVERLWPYSDDPVARERYPDVMEYPVGISLWAWGTAAITQAVSGSPDLEARAALTPAEVAAQEDVRRETLLYVVVNAVGLAVAALLATWFLAGVDRRRPWDAAAYALSPALALTALVNWDLLAVVLVAAALWAWARERPVLAGALIGLGAATKLYPLFLLGAVLVLCLRRRRFADLALTTAAAVAAWTAANLPAYLSGPDAWRVFWRFNSERGADLGSPWLVAAQALDVDISAPTINLWSWVAFGAWCAGVLAVGLAARRTPTLAQLGFLVVAGFLLVNKVYSPQYVLWLLPLAALARPRWRDQVVWQAGEVFYFMSVWWYLGGYLAPAGGEDAGFYWLAILVRMAGEVYLVGLVVADLLRRDRGPAAGSEPQVTSIRSNAVAV